MVDAFCLERLGEFYQTRCRVQAAHAAVAVEVSADAHVVDTRHAHGMENMAHRVVDAGYGIALYEKAVVERDLRHAALFCQGTQLVVREVARVIAQGAARGVGADDGHAALAQRIVERGLCSVREVDHHARAVHLAHRLAPEVAQSAVRLLRAACGVAEVVVAVVAERHVDNAHFAEMLYEAKVAPNGVAVFYTAHNRLDAAPLVGRQFVGRACQSHAPCAPHALFEFAEQPRRHACGIGASLVRERSLRDIRHHDAGVEATFCHLMEIHQQLRVAAVEVHAFVEEHRRVAVRVERQADLVEGFCLAECLRLRREVAEEGHHAFIAGGEEAFRVPLHAHDAARFVFHGLNHAVLRPSRCREAGTGVGYRLMVEGVDGKLVAQESAHQRALLSLHGVCGHTALRLLRMLDERRDVCRRQVLDYLSAERGGEHLDAPANAEHGYLPVAGKAYEKHFEAVAAGVDAAQSGHGLFAHVERIEVGAAREQDAVEAFEQADGLLGLRHGRRQHHGYAACRHDALVVAFGKLAALVAEVAGDAYERACFKVWEMVCGAAIVCAVEWCGHFFENTIYFFFSPRFGNHPFLTRSFCSKSSRIVQSDEKPVTPSKALAKVLSTNSAPTMQPSPRSRKIHHGRVPK